MTRLESFTSLFVDALVVAVLALIPVVVFLHITLSKDIEGVIESSYEENGIYYLKIVEESNPSFESTLSSFSEGDRVKLFKQGLFDGRVVIQKIASGEGY